jgi:hypothetical protein
VSLRLRTATLDERGLTFEGRDGALTLGPDGVRVESRVPVEHTDRWLAPTGASTDPVVVPWDDVRELGLLLPDTSAWRYRVLLVLAFFNRWETSAWFQRTTEVSVRWRLQGLETDLGLPPGRPNRRGDARMIENAVAILGERALLPALADRALLESLLSSLGGLVRYVPVVRGLVARRRAYRLVLTWSEADEAGRRALHRPVRAGSIGRTVTVHEKVLQGIGRAAGLVLAGLVSMTVVAGLLLDDDGSARPGVPGPVADVLFGIALVVVAWGVLSLLRVMVAAAVHGARHVPRRPRA